MLAVVATLAGTAGVVSHVRHTAREARLQALRRTGLTAATAGDDAATLAALGTVVAARPTDDEAAVAFAVARGRLDTSDGENVRVAVRVLQDVLARHPNDPAARRAMIDLLPRTGDTDELERLSDDALAANPKDAAAWRARVTVRLWQDRAADALAAAQAAAVTSPDDVDARLLVLGLMDRVGRPAAELAAYAESQFTDGDPRRLLLRAIAASGRGDTAAARTALRAAAAQAPSDPVLINRLVAAFDNVGAFDAAGDLLDRAARRTADVRLTRTLAWRLWQRGDGERLLAGLPGFDPAAPLADVELLAARAVALFDAGHSTDGRAIVARLARRPGRVAAGWTVALRARYVAPPATPALAAAAFGRALTKDPANVAARAWLAETYANAGEPLLALRQWTEAATAAPSWTRPQAGRAAALVALGDVDEAVKSAQAAYDRQPSPGAAVDLVGVRFAAFNHRPNGTAARELLAAIASVQNAWPDEPTTLAARVAILSRAGRREAATADVRRAILRVGPANLAPLIAVARAEALDVPPVAATFDSPAAALDRALAAADPDAGRAGLLAAAGANAGPNDAAWKLAEARYADATRAVDAPARWTELLAAFPNRLDVLQAFLARDNASTADRDAAAAAIERLRTLVGDDGRQWRFARARWLTDGPETGYSEAVSLLSDLVRDAPRDPQPRLELARVLARAGNPGTAIEHLRLAHAADPRATAPTVALFDLLCDQARGDEALALLREAAAAPALTWAERSTLATHAAGVGDAATAIRLLNVPAVPPVGRRLLARCYARTGHAAEAAAVLADLQSGSDPQVHGIADDQDSTPADEVSPVAAASEAVDAALARGDVNAAVALARNAVAGRPMDAEALALTVRALRPTGRWAEFRVAAERWAAAAQDDVTPAQIAVAEALLRTGHRDEATAVLRRFADRPAAAALLNEAVAAAGE